MQVPKSQGGWHQKDTKILKGSKRDQKGLKKEHVFFLMKGTMVAARDQQYSLIIRTAVVLVLNVHD
jgi:hypothetical protein